MAVIVVRTRVVALRTRASYELKVDVRGAAPDLLDPDVLDAVDVRGEVVVGDDDLDVLEGRVVPVSGGWKSDSRTAVCASVTAVFVASEALPVHLKPVLWSRPAVSQRTPSPCRQPCRGHCRRPGDSESRRLSERTRRRARRWVQSPGRRRTPTRRSCSRQLDFGGGCGSVTDSGRREVVHVDGPSRPPARGIAACGVGSEPPSPGSSAARRGTRPGQLLARAEWTARSHLPLRSGGPRAQPSRRPAGCPGWAAGEEAADARPPLFTMPQQPTH
jgi:hypothetical protein